MASLCIYFLVLLWYFGLSPIHCEDQFHHSPVVHIEHGAIKGKVIFSLTNKTIYSFLGIPYAKPPIKDLRFQVSLSYVNKIKYYQNNMSLQTTTCITENYITFLLEAIYFFSEIFLLSS